MSVDEKPADLTDRIDAEIADAAAGKEDIEPGSLEARLRLLFPGHTFWQKKSGMPAPLARLVERIGAEIVGLPEVPEQLTAIWSTPTGVWMIAIQACTQTRGETYHLKVEGPDTEVEREHLSADQVVEMLTAVGAISG